MQSYQNVSNSQQCVYLFHYLISCKRLCKVIKMLAIHNYTLSINLYILVANAYAKLSKCQQFTTPPKFFVTSRALQTLMQSYQNVSNSQQYLFFPIEKQRCKRLCKVIKMLAIHNCYHYTTLRIPVANAYAKLSKCQQFTTYH